MTTIWFTKEWWKYLLAPKAESVNWLKVIRCRAKGHPYGVIWYNPGGWEPDYTCKNCYDDLG